MNLDDARTLLSACVRDELRDHFFGDVEVTWAADGADVASGYFGHDAKEVWIGDARFEGDDARALRFAGKLGRVERNDTQGADERDYDANDGTEGT